MLLAIPLLVGCGSIPRDQEGTLDRIRGEGVVRVGLVSSASPPAHADRLRALVERSAAAAGGRPLILEEASEPLLLMLEAGEVDLVVGEFDRSSPWYSRVHLLPPLARETRGESEVEATGAARNGENGWIMLLEREAQALSIVQ
ncbi:MAG TPA: hypothetical protein VGB54_05675 [Allosphingosinicella sp.]|jgi:hypothetical protein